VAAGAVAFVLLSQKEEMISTLQPDAEGNEQDTSQTKGKPPSTPEEDPRGRDLPPKDSPLPLGKGTNPPPPGTPRHGSSASISPKAQPFPTPVNPAISSSSPGIPTGPGA
jgi:hypothetical protein